MSATRIGWFAGVLLASAVVLCTPAATAKNFEPGDLRVCNASRCVPINRRDALRALSSFYYTGRQPAIARAPRLGAPAFELRFDNGYVTGIVGTAKLDRFLSYGVYLERFRRGKWYRLPARAVRELRRLTAELKPLGVTPASVRRSR